jgi:hypothetical protein
VLYQADSLTYGGVWRGHEGLEQFFLAMSRAWDPCEMVDHGPDKGRDIGAESASSAFLFAIVFFRSLILVDGLETTIR